MKRSSKYNSSFRKLLEIGEGRENRTLTTRSEAWDSTIKLYPIPAVRRYYTKKNKANSIQNKIKIFSNS